MSIQPEELIDPREQEFWESDPSILRPPTTAQPEDDPRMVAIGMGIAAAVIGVGVVVRHFLKKKSPQTPEEARGLLMKAWETTHKHMWKKLVMPSLVSAYEVGAGGMVITPKQLELLASLYADELGDYFHQTSVDALVDGFSAQLNKGFNDKIAWGRSATGYGLDSRQTRSYIIGLIDQPKVAYEPTVVPASSQNAVDKAIMIRADRLGINESYKATQMGRNMVWVYLENEGELQGARKQWHTAEDERVCPVCAPLDGVTIGLHDRFESSGGEKFWVPGVHPNCRCWLSLVHAKGIDISKAMPGDPYDRDSHGQFSSSESRKANPIGIQRPPIGAQHVPIGGSGYPIGSQFAPLGSSFVPIGGALPPIGQTQPAGEVKLLTLADVLKPMKVKQAPIQIQPQVEVETPVKAKIKTKTRVKTKVKTPVKNKIKNQIKTPVKTPALVKSPVGNKVPALTRSDYEIQSDYLIIPGSSLIAMNNSDFKEWTKRSAEGKYFYLSGGGGVWGHVAPEITGKNAQEAWAEAFDREISMILPAAPVPQKTKASAFGVPHDRTDLIEAANTPRSGTTRSLSTVEGSTIDNRSLAVVMFIVDKGWRGELEPDDVEGVPDAGMPVGWYQVKQVVTRDGSKMSSYPEVVQDAMESGINPKPFHNLGNGKDLISQVIYITIKPRTGKPSDDNLILKRKWRD
jgi:hypothetical protein